MSSLNPNPSACDRELLRQSLGDSLPEEQENRLADHLSQCVACQCELERLAAEGFELSRIREPLRCQAELNANASVDGVAHTELGGPSHDDDYLNSQADFAVDFLDPATAPQTLGRLGEIDIHETIGRGGMGIVLRGFQQELNRPVAVKVLAPHLATSGAARKRFAREAQATAVIVHPNVMPILTVDSSGKLPYLVMPYVVCESLQQRLDRDGPLPTIDVLRIAMQIARGLAAAHAQGLVHRDIKPANVLLEKGVDRAMLTDFGLARAVDDASLTKTGVIAGTPQYMSPEQARGEIVDQRSDLFSLGSVMYAMCAGRPPFRAESSYGILRRITDNEPRDIREINPDIPDWLAAIIANLHRKHAAERLSSAEQAAGLLEQCLAHVQHPTVAPLPEGVRRLTRQASRSAKVRRGTSLRFLSKLGANLLPRRRLLVGLVAAGVLLISMFIGFAIREWPGSESQSPRGELKTTVTETRALAPVALHAVLGDVSPTTAWSDELDEDFQEMDRELHEFERLTDLPWEKDAVGPD